jgi:hypothetical protein
MTGSQLRKLLDELGWTQLGAARTLEVDGRTIRRWIADETAIPQSAAVLLRLIDAGKITPADVTGAARQGKKAQL